MNNRTVYTAIAVVLIAGSLLWIALGTKGRGGNQVERDRVSFEGETIDSLEMKLGACEVTIVEGTAFSLEYENLVRKKLAYSVKNGQLSIEYNSGKEWFTWLRRTDPKIVVTIPKDTVLEKATMNFGAAEIDLDFLETKSLSLVIGAGEMNVNRMTVTEHANIQVGAGSLEMKRAELNDAKLECGVGEISIDGVLTGTCRAKCGVGEISVRLSEKTQEDYAGNLKCGLGSVTFGDIKISGSGSRTYGSDGENTFDIECGVGEVEVIFR